MALVPSFSYSQLVSSDFPKELCRGHLGSWLFFFFLNLTLSLPPLYPLSPSRPSNNLFMLENLNRWTDILGFSTYSWGLQIEKLSSIFCNFVLSIPGLCSDLLVFFMKKNCLIHFRDWGWSCKNDTLLKENTQVGWFRSVLLWFYGDIVSLISKVLHQHKTTMMDYYG